MELQTALALLTQTIEARNAEVQALCLARDVLAKTYEPQFTDLENARKRIDALTVEAAEAAGVDTTGAGGGIE